MATESAICRRAFMLGAGAGLLSFLAPGVAFALKRSDAVLVSAGMKPDGTHCVFILTEASEPIWEAPLPGRGHGFAFHPGTGKLVAFARRPGSFALAFKGRDNSPIALATPAGRHFYGHGLFSADGQILLTTENDFLLDRGVLGLWDASDNYRRIGEYETFGLDPHDIVLLPDGRTLCVANGGILTHPDSGRAKLNLDSMKPSIVFIDLADGTLIARFEPPASLSRLSLRHLAAGTGGQVWFGAQWEGSEMESPPLIGRVSADDGLAFAQIGNETLARMRNYVGSVAANADGTQIAFTSPAGGHAIIVDVVSGQVAGIISQSKVCGASGVESGFILSSEDGQFGQKRHAVAWDNHIRPLRR
jgi:hypothetical protein